VASQREWESTRDFDHPARTAETNPAVDPSRGSVRAGFDSDLRDCEVRNDIGVPAAGSLLFYFCWRMPCVILLVFVLVSAAIDDKTDFKFKWLR
jgi:hypothetical protein